MDVDALLALRNEIDGTLEERSRELRQQLARLAGTTPEAEARQARCGQEGRTPEGDLTTLTC